MSVRVPRFNPVLWLTIVTWVPGITAPLGSLMVPKTVASWVCDHAHAEHKDKASRMRSLCGADLVYARTLPIINRYLLFCIAYVLHTKRSFTSFEVPPRLTQAMLYR